MNFKTQLKLGLLLLLLAIGGVPARAQWISQTNPIVPGWNAVYLFVDASSQTLDSLVGLNAACPIDQIWQWKTLPGTAQYLANPSSPLLGDSQWLTYYRPGTGDSTISRLSPNAAYLVHSSATSNFNWVVKGVPASPSYLWDNTGLNFIGLPTPSVNPPTLQNFLAPAPAFAAAVKLYQYAGGEDWANNPQRVYSLFTAPATRGKAFWASAANVNTAYYGPFKLTLPNATGLNFYDTVGQFTVYLENMTTNPLTVTSKLLASETPPSGQASIIGVPPLLVEGALNPTNLTYAYTALAANGTFAWTLAPAGQAGSQVKVVLGINRFAMTTPAGSFYAGVLRFTDSLGLSEMNVPVSATAANNAGLWVGSVQVSQVGQYLKTYATNSDGSYQFAVSTNSTYATNAAVLSATNLFIFSTLSSNTAVENYTVTNRVVNIYTATNPVVVTNGAVVGTNLNIAVVLMTNTVVTTTVTNILNLGAVNQSYQSSVTTNISTSATTNSFSALFTNVLAGIVTNNTPVRVTNYSITITYKTNSVTTNGPFLDPVTNLTVSAPVTNSVPNYSTNLASVVIATNPQVTVSSVTNLSTNSYGITTVTGSASSSTNYYPVTSPAKPVFVITNGSTWLVFNWITNAVVSTNTTVTAYNTNAFFVTNWFTIVGGITNAAGSVTNQTYTNRVAGSGVPLGSASTNVAYGYYTQPTAVITPTPVLSTNVSFSVTGLSTNLGDVPAAYPLRLILFNNGTQCSLLQRVYFGLGQGGTNLVVATQERALDPASLGTARRISSTMMPWTATNAPWSCAGTLAQGATLTVTVTEAYDDQAANPFLHTHHPDHNNLNYANSPPTSLPRGSQSYDISRTLTLLVSPNTQDFLTLTKGNTALGGQYTETITLTGLGGATRSYRTAGTFGLTRISTLSTLTTQ